ncbi:LysR family transcriptional regulator [Variovorax sp. WS11]|uniref:LysR substrate-binding domain-containing protein n=1 Tax=Variovorax sp. WS11 TaxID=1105204 RepID=UPI000D0DC2E3|nr:LysR substrate-binding domain-containing protein [Variovorax sp. WS11]NDZ15729.1 LysR family transcriptional regulator [Variovorax sp. WS11]PSL82905.1 LysR family transcriptional regulator [Variovorax sp. WS11]
MTVNFKTLRSFVTAVDAKSLSAAAQQLRVAQPALSQHIASLEEHFKHRLLNRSNAGVTPTRVGSELYRHAQIILNHLEQMEHELANRSEASFISGPVSVGLATYSTASILSMPLLQAVRREYPEINLFINDNFGLVLSEMVMTGRMDMAIIYAAGPMKGVTLQPLLTEDLCLIAPPGMQLPAGSEQTIALRSIAEMDLLLPSRTHFLRRLIDEAFARIGVTPRITAEIESAATLRQAIEAGVGATILPSASAHEPSAAAPPLIRRIVEPGLQATVSLCVPDHLPMSDQARAVLDILRRQIDDLFVDGRLVGIRAPEADATAR